MTAAPTQDSPIRADARDAWALADRAGSTSRARHLMITVDGGVSIPRVTDDAPVGTVCYDEDTGRPVLTRAHLSLDGDLELVTDHSRSQRWCAAQDFVFSDAALAQLRELRPRLASLDPKKFSANAFASGDGTTRTARADAEVSRALVRKYGTEDLKRLRVVTALCPEATRTISRLAAADDMMDLFLGSELIAQATEFHRVEHTRPYFRELFPMRNLNAPGATAYEAQHFDRRGRAEHTQDFAGRAPTATVKRTSKLRPLVWIRSGMRWSWLELQQWAQARSNGAALPDFVAEQRDASREACLELENLDLIFGNTALSLQGLLSPGNGIPQNLTPIDNFIDITDGDAKVEALLAGVKRIYSTEVEAGPFVIALGTRDYVYVTTTSYDSTNSTNESIAEVALRRGKALGLQAIVRMPELGFSQLVKDYLAGLGYKDPLLSLYSGGIDVLGDQLAVMVTFTRNPRKLRGVTGQDFMQLPPDRTSTETHVQVCLSTGGVEVPFPMAADIQTIKDPAP